MLYGVTKKSTVTISINQAGTRSRLGMLRILLGAIMSNKIQSLVAKSRSLKAKALEIDVKEYVWCQRGACSEKIELITVLPTKYHDQALCAFHTKFGEKAGWFTARLYLTQKAAKAANLLEQWHHKIEADNGRVYAVKAEWEIWAFDELINNLVEMGLSIDLIPKFGIVPQV